MPRRRLHLLGADLLRTATILLLSSANLNNLLVQAQSTGDENCQDVHLFVARGDGEQYPGRIGDIPTAVCGTVANCDYEDIQYTSVDGSVYCDSVYQGANNGISQILAYHKRCPDAMLVLGGYSLGANVVGDILGGGGNLNMYDCSENGVQSVFDPFSGAGRMIMFGDVRHTGNQTFDLGTGAPMDGQYPRSDVQLAGISRWADRLHNYCLSTDPICALGNDGESHTTYMTVFAQSAGAWIVSRLSNFSNYIATAKAQPTSTFISSSSTSSSSSSATGSVTGSATRTAASTTSTVASYTPFRFGPDPTTATTATAPSGTTTITPAAVATPDPPMTLGVEAGLAAGGAALLASIIGLIWYLIAGCRRRSKKKEEDADFGTFAVPATPKTPASGKTNPFEQETSYNRVAGQDYGMKDAIPLPNMVHDPNRDHKSGLYPNGRYDSAMSPGLGPRPPAPWEQGQHNQRASSLSYGSGGYGHDAYTSGYGDDYGMDYNNGYHNGGGQNHVYGNGYGDPYARSTETLGLGHGQGMYGDGRNSPGGYSQRGSPSPRMMMNDRPMRVGSPRLDPPPRYTNNGGYPQQGHGGGGGGGGGGYGGHGQGQQGGQGWPSRTHSRTQSGELRDRTQHQQQR